MSIQEGVGKIKEGIDKGAGEWGIPIIIALVAFACFGLGRMSARENVQPVISIAEASEGSQRAMAMGGLVVASRTGSAYHYPWCGGAETIKEGNKVWFKDEAAARAAGYSPAKNCKGLK